MVLWWGQFLPVFSGVFFKRDVGGSWTKNEVRLALHCAHAFARMAGFPLSYFALPRFRRKQSQSKAKLPCSRFGNRQKVGVSQPNRAFSSRSFCMCAGCALTWALSLANMATTAMKGLTRIIYFSYTRICRFLVLVRQITNAANRFRACIANKIPIAMSTYLSLSPNQLNMLAL